MKIEKINENKIRCILDSKDLTDRQINVGELAYGSTKARSLFREMMQRACTDLGFKIDDEPLMVEAIPLAEGSIMLIITKVDDPEELDTRFAKFSPVPDDEVSDEPEPQVNVLESAGTAEQADSDDETSRIFSFPSLDSVSCAAEVLCDIFDGSNSLYRNPVSHEYFLAVNGRGYAGDEFARVLNTLSEFGTCLKNASAKEAYYREHYETVIDGIALQVLKDI